MDYTHSTSFFPGAPPYQFMGSQVAPLTPSHSNSVVSDDFNTTSPPVGCSLPAPPIHPITNSPQSDDSQTCTEGHGTRRGGRDHDARPSREGERGLVRAYIVSPPSSPGRHII